MGTLISIVVPVFNEAAHLLRNLGTLGDYLDTLAPESYEFIVVDDGSTDSTPALLQELAGRMPRLTPYFHDKNRGMHAALRTGIAHTHGDRVVTFDADLTYSVETIRELLDALECNSAQIALASPYASGGRCIGVPWIRRMLSESANRYLSLAVRGKIRTLTCMVRAYDGPLLRRLVEERPTTGFTYEILLRARRAGASVVEVPAVLDWSKQPPERGRRLRLIPIARMILDITAAGVHDRPILYGAIPGLIPGLLPTVIFIAILFRLPLKGIALVATITIVIQYTSLLFFSLQLGDYALRLRRTSKRVHSTGSTTNAKGPAKT